VLPIFDIFINGPGTVNLRSAYNAAGSPTADGIRFIVQSDIGAPDTSSYAIDTGDWSDKPASGQPGYQRLYLIVPAGKWVAGRLGAGNPGTGTGAFNWGIGSPGGDAIRVRTHNLNIPIGSANGGIAQYNAINWYNPDAGQYGNSSSVGGGGGGAGKEDLWCNGSPIGRWKGCNGAGWNGTNAVAACAPDGEPTYSCCRGGKCQYIYTCKGGDFGAAAPTCGAANVIPSAAGAPSGYRGTKVDAGYVLNYL
jgi:hypothetical protein